MLILPGTFLIVISFLLFRYYRIRANEDDLNRPSFFNSKIRTYFLIICAVLMFTGGECLLLRERLYYWIVLLPPIYYVVFYSIKKEECQNTVIEKTFHNYRVFSDPSLSFSQTEILTAPVHLLVSFAKMPKSFCDLTRKYLEKRVKEGKIKTVRDLPQEAWTVIGCIGKEEIKENPSNVLTQKKIDYYYEEIIEGKEHKNLLKSFLKWLSLIELHFERLFMSFAFTCSPRPDFTSEEVDLSEIAVSGEGVKEIGQTKELAIFPNAPLYIAIKFGWVTGSSEYYHLAALEFQRRYPEHKFSRQIKKQHKFKDEQIFDYAQNWEKLDTEKIKLFS